MTSKYISNNELARFNLFYRPTVEDLPDYYMLDALPPIDEIFNSPDVFYSFIFISYPRQQIGHWCLLIKHSATVFEWFDCLGKAVPELLKQRLQEYADLHDLEVITEKLTSPIMGLKNWICGKWCMFRVMTLPNDLITFKETMEKLSIQMKPDDIVDFTVNFKI